MSKLFFELVSNCVVDFNGRKNNKNTNNNGRLVRQRCATMNTNHREKNISYILYYKLTISIKMAPQNIKIKHQELN